VVSHTSVFPYARRFPLPHFIRLVSNYHSPLSLPLPSRRSRVPASAVVLCHRSHTVLKYIGHEQTYNKDPTTTLRECQWVPHLVAKCYAPACYLPAACLLPACYLSPFPACTHLVALCSAQFVSPLFVCRIPSLLVHLCACLTEPLPYPCLNPASPGAPSLPHPCLTPASTLPHPSLPHPCRYQMDSPLGSCFVDPDDIDAIATGSMWSGGRLTHAALRVLIAFATLARLNRELRQQGSAAGASSGGAGLGMDAPGPR
jgi:hypothetical protein